MGCNRRLPMRGTTIFVVLIELSTRSGNAVSFLSALLFLLFLFW